MEGRKLQSTFFLKDRSFQCRRVVFVQSLGISVVEVDARSHGEHLPGPCHHQQIYKARLMFIGPANR